MAAVLGAVVIWGGSFVVIKDGLRDLGLFHFLGARFAISAVLLVALATRRHVLKEALRCRAAWLLGAILFASFALQTEGLRTTSPSRSAFLTSLSVLIVPLLVWLSRRSPPGWTSWLGVALATAGLAITFGVTTAAWHMGDSLSLLCAFSFAAYLIVAQQVVRRIDVIGATAVQSLAGVALSVAFLPLDSTSTWGTSGRAILAIGYTGALATCLAFGLQLFGQTRLSAVQTGVLLALEPLVAATISVGLGNDKATVTLLVGGALLISGAVVVQIEPRGLPV